MRVNQVGEPRVYLSFDRSSDDAPEGTGFVGVSFEVTIDERAEGDGPMVAKVRCVRGKLLNGRAIEKGPRTGWLVFQIPRDLCPAGKSLRFRALVDKDVLWQGEYEIVWRGRFPGLIPTT
jgi:hypothetical protein